MHVLVTGGQGYIGNHLTHALLCLNHSVTTLDSGFDKKPFEFAKSYEGKLRRFEASILNPDAIARSMVGVNAVIHLAARMDFNPSYRHPARVINCNVDGTCNVLSMAKRVGIQRVVIASSAAVYGSLINASEVSPLNPLNIYGSSKVGAEAVGRAFFQEGQDVVILRLYNTWGGRNSRSVISKFASGCKRIFGDGTQTRDFVYIDDVIRAFIAALQWEPNIYNIGSGIEVEINALWKTLNEEQPEYEDYAIGYQEPLRSMADTTFTTAETGWKARTILPDLCREDILRLCS
jgi:UDP-glucose 4-epimerase